MSIQKAEMTVELKENDQYVEQVAYPFVEYDHVAMENGMDIMSMIRDDVSTPMVTHNTTSWKVGQGDSDVSETIVDSSVANMTIKGQAYQNILPNPSLRNSMTNGKTMQKLNEGYDSVNTVDGVCKSAILKGQTLVNLVGDVVFVNPTSADKTLPTTLLACDFEIIDLKENTTYTIFYDIESDDIENKPKIGFLGKTTENASLNWLVNVGNLTLGKNKVLLKTPSFYSYQGLRIHKNDAKQIDITINSLMVLEGDYTNVDIPYFEGMRSVKMPVLTTYNTNNIFNPNNVEESGTYDYLSLDYFPVELGTKLSTTSKSGTIYWSSLFLYSKDKTLIKENFKNSNVSEKTFIIDNEKVKYVRFAVPKVRAMEVILNYGDIIPYEPYQPYKSNILSCNEDVELGSVGEVKDELNLLTKQLTQRTETRPYQEGDELNSEVVTDMTNTRYKLPKEVIKTVDLSILDQDNQPTTQLNSFANGYIQVSSQGLIPSVDYEVPTSNSYYVDLMKANTQYTMKNMQGTFTIDGIQYNASANGTFTSPSTLTNKFMITNVVQTQPMLLEGDMTNKEVPYVEGIKSTFDGVDKVEIYSVGKNLFDGEIEEGVIDGNTGKPQTYGGRSRSKNFIRVPKNTDLYIKVENGNSTSWTTIYGYDENKKYLGSIINSPDANKTFNTGDASYIKWKNNTPMDTLGNIQIEEGTQATSYEPYKSNTTSFQLPNPLHSLPNGVRDEIALDRQNHKAHIIQRVGEDLTQLDTPNVTEVNLGGYPYVYKGGHIFLNTEIAPITEVTYSINQAHQIESSNEDILRHQKEINQLYELIAQYVQVQYEAELIDIALQG